MPNYLAVDSGGTKVLAILYDENFHPIRISRVGSCRANTTSSDLVALHLATLKEELALTKDLVISRVTGIMDSSFLHFLKENCTVEEVVGIGEMEAGLLAAEILGDGILALSGTGSNISLMYQGQGYSAGGYGASVSDAGSGYWLSRYAMEMAIADFEGRGEYTLLTELIAKRFGYDREHFREAIFSIYSNPEISPVAQVASCSPLVTEAANGGDAIALKILKAAGQIMGDQLTALIRRYQLPDDLPLTISGSAWKSNRIFFDTFAACVLEQSAKRPLIIPEFEPIIGVLIKHYLEVYGSFNEEAHAAFQENYPQFTFRLPFAAN